MNRRSSRRRVADPGWQPLAPDTVGRYLLWDGLAERIGQRQFPDQPWLADDGHSVALGFPPTHYRPLPPPPSAESESA